MMKAVILMVCVSLAGCANARFASNDYQCKRNPAVDGVGIGVMTGVPFAVVASSPIGLGVGVIMGGAYYVTHEAICE